MSGEEFSMRVVRLSLVLCVASFVGVLVQAPVRAQIPAPAPVQLWGLTPVADGVYAAIGKNGAFGNCAVVINRDDVLVVDGSMRPSGARDLVAQIKKLTDKPVRYVVNTHWHPDHTQGNQAYLEAYGPGVEFIAQHLTDEDITGKELP